MSPLYVCKAVIYARNATISEGTHAANGDANTGNVRPTSSREGNTLARDLSISRLTPLGLAERTTLRTCCPVKLADFIKISARHCPLARIAPTSGTPARKNFRLRTEVAGFLVVEDLDLRHLFLLYPRKMASHGA
jgi:hypothetical protein